MTEWLIQNEGVMRLSAFLGLLIVIMICKFRSPTRQLQYARWLRWSSNLGTVVTNSALR